MPYTVVDIIKTRSLSQWNVHELYTIQWKPWFFLLSRQNRKVKEEMDKGLREQREIDSWWSNACQVKAW